MLLEIQYSVAPLLLAAIPAAIGALGAAVNAMSQGSANRKNIQFQKDMYKIQRNDALSDWRMNNQYNSPEEQMRRLKNAGLNPNLVYGQGAVANSSSMPSATPTRNTNIAPINYDLSSIGDFVGSYMNIKTQMQQLDNLKAQNELIKEQKQLTNAKYLTELERPDLLKEQTTSTFAKTQWGGQAAERERSYFEPTLQGKVEKVRSLQADIAYKQAQTDFTKAENIRQQEMQPYNVDIAVQKVLNMKAQEAKDYEEIKRISAVTKLTKTKEVQEFFENINRSTGSSFKDNYLLRNGLGWMGTNENVNRVMREIFPGWERMSDSQKMTKLLQLQQSDF